METLFEIILAVGFILSLISIVIACFMDAKYAWTVYFISAGLLIISCFGLACTKDNNKTEIKAEYHLEILNQDSVAVYSLSTDKIYYVSFDKVEDVLLKDNL